MRGVERPISPIKRSYSASPLRGVSEIEIPGKEPIKNTTPEYHPTPKKDGDTEYEEYRRGIEMAKATGAIKKFVIQKLGKEEENKQRRGESPREQRDPRIERQRSPRRQEKEKSRDLSNSRERDSSSPRRRHDWKKDSERRDSRDSSREGRRESKDTKSKAKSSRRDSGSDSSSKSEKIRE